MGIPFLEFRLPRRKLFMQAPEGVRLLLVVYCRLTPLIL